MRLSSTRLGGPATQGRHRPCCSAPPAWETRGTGRGQSSTYSTGSCERPAASPAPPGRHTGERDRQVRAVRSQPSCSPPSPCPGPDSAPTYIVLVPHGIELLQLLGPIPGLLLGDICEGKAHGSAPHPDKTGPHVWGLQDQTPNPEACEHPWGWGQGRMRPSTAVPRDSTHPAAARSGCRGGYGGKWGPWCLKSHCRS